MSLSPFRLERSLSRCATGRVVSILGASNQGGSNDGTFGTNVLTKPAWATLYCEGVLKAAYDTIHGVEVGFLAELEDQGDTDPITVIRYTVSSTQLSQWITTHAAAAVADAAAIGLVPTACSLLLMNADTDTTAKAEEVAARMRRVEEILRASWVTGGKPCGFAWGGPTTTDLVAYPGCEIGRQQVVDAVAALPGWRAHWSASGLPLQTASVHLTSAGYIESGRRQARALLAAGVL